MLDASLLLSLNLKLSLKTKKSSYDPDTFSQTLIEYSSPLSSVLFLLTPYVPLPACLSPKVKPLVTHYFLY